MSDIEEAIKQLDNTMDFLKARAKMREALVEVAKQYGYEMMKKAAQSIDRAEIMAFLEKKDESNN